VTVTVDAVVFAMQASDLAVLLVKPRHGLLKGQWRLPGGPLEAKESLDESAARHLYASTGLSHSRLVQLAAFGDPDRDPRSRTVSIAFVGYRGTEIALCPGEDEAEAQWVPLRDLELGEVTDQRSIPPPRVQPRGLFLARPSATRSKPTAAPSRRLHLALDHERMVRRAYRRLCHHLNDPPADPAFDLLPPRFTLAELRRIYEVVLGRSVTPRTLRTHFIDRGLLVAATKSAASKPAAQLYRWQRR